MPRMGWQLRGYRWVSHVIALAGPVMLRRRLARGKEDPARWREKLGQASAARPEGGLVWMHAVGLGEVLALRGLIEAMAAVRPELSFLVTSSARSSAEAFGSAAPPRTRHQYLPLDAPRYVARFLAHWRPDLSIWAEQDLWPNAVVMAGGAGVPLAMVNARMGEAAFARRRRAAGLYGAVLARFGVVAAQDAASAAHLACLGAEGVEVMGPLKAAAGPLPVDMAELAQLQASCAGRRVRLLASSHATDEVVLAGAFGPVEDLVIIAPRDVGRGREVAERFAAQGMRVGLRSEGADPSKCDVYVADRFGEMGLWYRLADVALIGGTFGAVEGHNPWEAAALGCAVLHGPRVGNFMSDFRMLQQAEAALEISVETLEQAWEQDHDGRIAAAMNLVEDSRRALVPLAGRLCAMVTA